MGVLYLICLVYFLFGATAYVGTLWCVRLFLYPSWVALTPDNVGVHFVGPTRAATRFFIFVVPLMFPTGIALIVASWGDTLVWVASLAVLGVVSTVVGIGFILPVNKKIAAGVAAAELTPLLKRWMFLNDIRFVTTTVMWGAAVWYALAVGDAYGALS
jgi:hypothetical protein